MRCNKKILAMAIAAAPLWQVANAVAQEDQIEAPKTDAGNIEEVVVVARLKSSAENVVFERLESEAVTDLMSSELIGRIGDSNVATALRRVPGVTLVDDKFIYVRGLGERYSSTLLNGAAVPSPDLTRSVLPLDIFPTSIVETLAVQKSYSADMPAAFGGGNVDIRTKGIPEEFVFNVELGTSYNEETSGSGLSYNGGGDDEWGTDDGERALPKDIKQALDAYQGNLSTLNIYNILKRQDATTTLADAKLVNRQLASTFKRDISVYKDDPGENINGQVNVGNRFYLDNGIELGFLAGGSYDHSFDTVERETRIFADPEEQVGHETQSTRTVNMTGNLGFGIRLNDEQEISTTSLYLRNTDDVAAVTNFHDDNRKFSSGTGFQDTDIRFEEREMIVNQIKGSHTWGQQTRDLLNQFVDVSSIEKALPWLDQLKLDWYYSDSEVSADIPSQVRVYSNTKTDPVTGEVLNSAVQLSDAMADYRFTELDDDVLSEGWDLTLPVFIKNFDIELSGGWDYVRKTRTYRQLDFRIGSTDSDALGILNQPLTDVFSDQNLLNDSYGFALDVSAASARSYIAATTNEAWYGKADITWQDTWRLIAGVRYEQYNQVGLPWQPLVYNSDGTKGQISMDANELANAVFTDDGVYPSVSLVYMGQNFLAETFQLRFSWSQTVVRPDLREIADTSYLDPVTGALVYGNPDVVPSDVDNFDIRAEWFFDNSDNFTASLFYKNIDNPIEFFERGASDTKVASEIINAETAELYGIEFEGLKGLEFLGDAFTPFFVSGNLTLLDHELQVGDRADSPTKTKRGLAGASDYVANIQLGFDSDDGKHAATLVYNVFGKRLYTAGRLGSPDAYEKPFESLDMTYSYYPLDNLTVKAKLKNLLDESVVIERGGVDVFTEKKGMEASLSVKYDF